MMLSRTIAIGLCAVSVALLCACGGGGGSSDHVPVSVLSPTDAVVVEPAAAAFKVAPSYAQEASVIRSIQWQLSVDGGATWADIPGASKLDYQTPATTTADSGKKYRVIVSSDVGDVSTGAASLTVIRMASPPWHTAESIAEGSAPQVATDAAGNAFAVWTQGDPKVGDGGIAASRYDATTGAWSAPVPPGATLGGALEPQVEVDAAGNAMAIWRRIDGSASQLVASRYLASAGAWNSTTVIDASASGVSQAQVKIDANGNAIAAWIGPSATVVTSRYGAASAAWEPPLAHASGAAYGFMVGLQLAADSSGDAIAVWIQGNDGPDSVVAVRYSAAKGAWGTPTVVEGALPFQWDYSDRGPSVAMDAHGNAIVVWFNGGIFASRYRAESDTWSSPTPIVSASGSPPRIAMNAAGDSIVAWTGTGSIWTIRFDATQQSWGSAAIIDSGGLSGDGPQIAMDAAGNAIAVWRRSTSSNLQAVMSNRYTAGSGTWGKAVAIASGDVVSGPQITVNAAGTGTATWVQRSSDMKLQVYANRYE